MLGGAIAVRRDGDPRRDRVGVGQERLRKPLRGAPGDPRRDADWCSASKLSSPRSCSASSGCGAVMRIKVVLGVGLALIAIAFAVTLSHAPATVAQGAVRAAPTQAGGYDIRRSPPARRRNAPAGHHGDAPRPVRGRSARGCRYRCSRARTPSQTAPSAWLVGRLGDGTGQRGAPYRVAPVKVCFGCRRSVIGRVGMLGITTPRPERRSAKESRCPAGSASNTCSLDTGRGGRSSTSVSAPGSRPHRRAAHGTPCL